MAISTIQCTLKRVQYLPAGVGPRQRCGFAARAKTLSGGV